MNTQKKNKNAAKSTPLDQDDTRRDSGDLLRQARYDVFLTTGLPDYSELLPDLSAFDSHNQDSDSGPFAQPKPLDEKKAMASELQDSSISALLLQSNERKENNNHAQTEKTGRLVKDFLRLSVMRFISILVFVILVILLVFLFFRFFSNRDQFQYGLSSSEALEFEQLLEDNFYSPGPVDGILDNTSLTAVRNFASDVRLEAQEPSKELLDYLREVSKINP